MRKNFKPLKIWPMVFIFALIGSGALAKQSDCDIAVSYKAAIEIQKMQNFVQNNTFVIDRGLELYFVLLFGLQRRIEALSENSTWLDLGAGQAVAQREFTERRADVRLIALGVKRPDIRFVDPPNFTYLQTEFESLDTSKFAKVDLITDVMGVVSYATQIDLVLKKSLSLLRIGGSMFIYFQPDKIRIKRYLFDQGFRGYLRSIGGIKIINPEMDVNSVQLLRTSDPLTIPSLRLLDFRDGAPAFRSYRIQ